MLRLTRAGVRETLPMDFVKFARAKGLTPARVIFVHVLNDEHGITLFSKARGSGPNDGLLGFTGSTVTVRFGSIIYTYGERGETVFAKAA